MQARSGETESELSTQDFLLSGPEKWTSREGLSSSLQILLLLTVLSLAPAILLMTTCYVRIIVVMGLLRQALGTGQLPPSQVITSISLFMTMFVMAPVWNQVYQECDPALYGSQFNDVDEPGVGGGCGTHPALHGTSDCHGRQS